MLTKIAGGDIVDPVNGRVGKGDLWIADGRIVEARAGGRAERTIDASGCIVMAGAIDIHSHIGGGNVNTARLLLPEQHSAHQRRPATLEIVDDGRRLPALKPLDGSDDPVFDPATGRVHAYALDGRGLSIGPDLDAIEIGDQIALYVFYGRGCHRSIVAYIYN